MVSILVPFLADADGKSTPKRTSQIAEKAAPKSEIDIVDGFASRMLLNVIWDVLDLPQEAHEMFHGG